MGLCRYSSWSTTTGSDGSYDLDALPAGDYKVVFGGDSSSYLTKYYDDKTSLLTADDVAVTAGGTTSGIDAVVVLGGRISGTVRGAAGAGLSGIRVGAYRSDGTGGYIVQTTSGADGTYSLGPLPAGAVKVGFSDPAGAYADQYFEGMPTRSTGADVAVTAGATTPGIDADMTPGAHVRGTVRDADGVVAGVWVTAYRASGTGYEYLRRATTGADGSYDLGPLPPGPLSIQFWDNGGAHVSEWYDDKTSFAASDPLTMIIGGTVSSVDALLQKAGYVSGTVTETGQPARRHQRARLAQRRRGLDVRERHHDRRRWHVHDRRYRRGRLPGPVHRPERRPCLRVLR